MDSPCDYQEIANLVPYDEFLPVRCVGSPTWILWMWIDSGAMLLGAIVIKGSTAFTFPCRFLLMAVICQ